MSSRARAGATKWLWDSTSNRNTHGSDPVRRGCGGERQAADGGGHREGTGIYGISPGRRAHGKIANVPESHVIFSFLFLLHLSYLATFLIFCCFFLILFYIATFLIFLICVLFANGSLQLFLRVLLLDCGSTALPCNFLFCFCALEG